MTRAKSPVPSTYVQPVFMARFCCLSWQIFCNDPPQPFLREETGITFSGYRLWLKMRGAVLELAKDTDLGRAALNGGFADQSHFNRIVRRSFGFTPTWFVQSGLQVKTFLA